MEKDSVEAEDEKTKLAGEYKKYPVERGISGLGEPLGCK